MTKSKSGIKKGLYRCSAKGDLCMRCPYYYEQKKFCIDALMSDALELIEQQKKELDTIYGNVWAIIEQQDTDINTIYDNLWGIINERAIF